ncbi:uncharacterized protein LOC135248636 isoform X2 [Anguilla rostrata]|uniref:uncharacterized protein LOC135248636 isoform X2 n=1 Tax=Anguilla rostrata TaxID=7938 RepID=UPI0030D503E6
MSKCDSASSPAAGTDGVRGPEKPPGLGDHLPCNIENKNGITISPTYNRCVFGGYVSNTMNTTFNTGGPEPASPSTGVGLGMNRGQAASKHSAHTGVGDADDGDSSTRKRRRVDPDTLGAKDVASTEPGQDSRQVAPEDGNVNQKSVRFGSFEQHGSSLSEQNEKTPDNPIPPPCPCIEKRALPSSTIPHFKPAKALKFDIPKENLQISDEMEDPIVGVAMRIVEDRHRVRGTTERGKNGDVVSPGTAGSGSGQIRDCRGLVPEVDDPVERVVGEVIAADVKMVFVCPEKHEIHRVNEDPVKVKCNECDIHYKKTKMTVLLEGTIMIERDHGKKFKLNDRILRSFIDCDSVGINSITDQLLYSKTVSLTVKNNEVLHAVRVGDMA